MFGELEEKLVRAERKEVKTNRICLAPSIIQCLRALEIYKYFQEDTLDVKVYKIVVDENDEQLTSWEQL